MRFNDRVAVVTGAAQGIGRAIARQLAEQGALVVIADIDGERRRESREGIDGLAASRRARGTWMCRFGAGSPPACARWPTNWAGSTFW